MKVKNYFIITICFIGFIFSENLDNDNKYKKNKKTDFLENINVDDPAIMDEINKLKRNFNNERESIRNKYDKRIHQIK